MLAETVFMDQHEEHLLHEALALPPLRRRALISRLLDSLPLGEDDAALAEEIRRLTPRPEEYERLASRFPPPQSWFDETADPFKPASG